MELLMLKFFFNAERISAPQEIKFSAQKKIAMIAIKGTNKKGQPATISDQQ